MSNEIKVGDKVRVSKDAPRIYTQTCIYPSVHNADFEIMDIEDGCANIKNTESFITTEYVIPLKYLIKVEDEAKEPKFKVGDFAYCNLVKVKITAIRDNGDIVARTYDNYQVVGRECDFEPYTEPTEEKEPTDLTKEVANNLSNVLEGCCNAINNIANNFDWDAYTADLAHDIAVKIVNKNMDSEPEKVGSYAVNLAKSVVEELKRK